MRGKVQPERDVQDAARITPAYAGKRKPPPDRHKNWGGITPACAGKRLPPLVQHFRLWDYPRVCGEKLSTTSTDIHPAGSPPRMRGKAFGLVLYKVEIGIIPACAGKSALSAGSCPCSRDHPRLCGEKVRAYVKIWNEWGSPPRMRGKGGSSPGPQNASRITPAYAGKSSHFLLRKRSKWDHPRVCGEKHLVPVVGVLGLGSPPRVRGKVLFLVLNSFLYRDHPRVCGEKCPPGKFFFMTVGSPPRMRGKVPSSI